MKNTPEDTYMARHLARKHRSEINHRYYLKRKARVQRMEAEPKHLLSVRLPASLLARLRRIVSEGVAVGSYPWKTMTEAVQGLLIMGLESMKGDEFIDEMLPHLEVMQQLERIRGLRAEAKTTVHRAKEEVAELLGIDAVTEATQYFHVTLDALRKLPPTAWSEWAIKDFTETFPRLNGKRPAGVMPLGKRKQKARA